MSLSAAQRKEIGERLARLRQFGPGFRCSQTEMANRMDISRSHYSQIERGQIQFTAAKIERICETAGIPPESILGFLQQEMEEPETPYIAQKRAASSDDQLISRVVGITMELLSDAEKMERIMLVASDLGLSVRELVYRSVIKRLDSEDKG